MDLSHIAFATAVIVKDTCTKQPMQLCRSALQPLQSFHVSALSERHIANGKRTASSRELELVSLRLTSFIAICQMQSSIEIIILVAHVRGIYHVLHHANDLL